MWHYRNILIHILGYFLVISANSFDDAAGHSSSFERKLMVKLKTATRLKHNLGKILHEFPVQNYELYYSVKTIEDYLKNGGSLIECLDILPFITFAPIGEQIESILGSMEDHLPKYLMPAISLIKRSLVEDIVDTDEIYRPVWGPPKSDLLKKIPLRELKEAASPLIYREQIENLEGPWSKIIGETVSLINHKVIPPRRKLIAYVLANLRIPDATTEVRESVTLLVEHLQSYGERELIGFRTSFDPYELVANAILSLSLQNETLIAANILLPILKKPSKCRRSSELVSFFQNNTFNYTLLISRNGIISSSKVGITFLSIIQQNNPDVRETIEQLFPFEYTSWRDLSLAFVSQLRRQQIYRGIFSEVVDGVYGELILKNTRKHWQLLRKSIITASMFSVIARKKTSVKIQRLLIDVAEASDRLVSPITWRNALVFGSSKDINGPIDAALKTLKALQTGFKLYSVLQTHIAELTNIYANETMQEWSKCNNRLEIYLTNFTQVEAETGKKTKNKDIDVEDLLQALPDLDVYTDEYRSLKNFLSQNNLARKIGQTDVNAHPTRGRLLAQLLQMTEHSNGVDDSLRRLAKQFIDSIAYEGYGASAFSHRSN